MKLLIIGADGQLGSDFLRFSNRFKYDTIGLTINDIDISKAVSIDIVLSQYKFDGIINTAAYHAKEAYNDTDPNKHFAVNAFGPYYLSKFCEINDKFLVHYSTDYVFNGNNVPKDYSFNESDKPIPSDLYGASKYAGENLIQITNAHYYLFRVASIYGLKGCKAKGYDNFVEMVIRKYEAGEKLSIVDDIIMSPTSTEAIIEGTIKVIRAKKLGLYHLAGQGKCSWYEFAEEIFTLMRYSKKRLEKVKRKNIIQDIDRGSNTSLNNKKLNDMGITIDSWQIYLERYLRNRNK